MIFTFPFLFSVIIQRNFTEIPVNFVTIMFC